MDKIYEAKLFEDKAAYDEIIKAVDLTEWDNGFLLKQPCKVNTKTYQVFDIEYDFETLDTLENLQNEWVVIGGIRYPVLPKDTYICSKDPEFWYDENE